MSKIGPRVAIIFARLGPYHVARLAAANARLGGDCLALEVASESREYAWDRVETRGFRRRTVIADRDYQDVPNSERASAVYSALEDEQPRAVAISGWGFPEDRAALAWCRRNDRVAVVMSESQERDLRRSPLRETLKRALVAEFDAALVGGERHVAYLARLGMPRERILLGYDVVDNQYFEQGAEAARGREFEERHQRALPKDYFLCSARFVRKKNLPGLLRAYAAYRAMAGNQAWKLVILGDGPLRASVERLIRRLALEPDVRLPGFKQYGDLPAYYGLARAFVLPSYVEQWGLVVNEAMAAGLPVLVSDACGSVDLVQAGANGWTFQPSDHAQLARLMLQLSRDPVGTARMGQASSTLIDRWTPKTFAEGLDRAMQIGEAYRRGRQTRRLPNPALWY